jgi:hypothetical protein
MIARVFADGDQAGEFMMAVTESTVSNILLNLRRSLAHCARSERLWRACLAGVEITLLRLTKQNKPPSRAIMLVSATWP